MKAHTALGLVLAGGALSRLARPGQASPPVVARTTACTLALRGFATLGQYQRIRTNASRSTVHLGSTFIVLLPLSAVPPRTARREPDLSRLDCNVLGSNLPAQDIAVYVRHVRHAGAQVVLASNLATAADQTLGSGTPVASQNTGQERMRI